MSTHTVTPGRTVSYVLAEADVEAITTARQGTTGRVGNAVSTGDVVSGVVTRVWSEECVNLQLTLDGNDQHWVTSRIYDPAPGSPGRWFWPPRV